MRNFITGLDNNCFSPFFSPVFSFFYFFVYSQIWNLSPLFSLHFRLFQEISLSHPLSVCLSVWKTVKNLLTERKIVFPSFPFLFPVSSSRLTLLLCRESQKCRIRHAMHFRFFNKRESGVGGEGRKSFFSLSYLHSRISPIHSFFHWKKAESNILHRSPIILENSEFK